MLHGLSHELVWAQVPVPGNREAFFMSGGEDGVDFGA